MTLFFRRRTRSGFPWTPFGTAPSTDGEGASDDGSASDPSALACLCAFCLVARVPMGKLADISGCRGDHPSQRTLHGRNSSLSRWRAEPPRVASGRSDWRGDWQVQRCPTLCSSRCARGIPSLSSTDSKATYWRVFSPPMIAVLRCASLARLWEAAIAPGWSGHGSSRPSHVTERWVQVAGQTKPEQQVGVTLMDRFRKMRAGATYLLRVSRLSLPGDLA